MENIINNILLTSISVILVIGLKELINFTKEKVKNIKDEKAKKAIEKALEIVTLAVNETNQSFVGDLKKQGKFDKASMEDAFNNTKVRVLELLDKETKEILNEEFENADKFLNSAIESKVWESK
ncbi:MAG: hypothetical protein Q4B36_05220 [Tissierellia bacterium]|nr:hypothetical protein [Tissierellia bacterium]